MPLAGWVWQTKISVAELNHSVEDIEGQVEKLEGDVEEYEKNTRTLIGVEKDIEHIRDALSRIEELVTQ